MVSRRAFLGFTAALPLGASAETTARAASVAPALATVPARKTGRVEIAFKSPGSRPNGLQATADGLWIIDQAPGSRVYLVGYGDGRVLRSFETDTSRPSGITFDGQALWIGSTFSYENVRCDATTGAVLERRPTPGCTTYQLAGDPAPRRSPLARPAAAAATPAPPSADPPPRPGSPSRRTCVFRAPTGRSGVTAGCGPRPPRRDPSMRSTRSVGWSNACCRPPVRGRTAWPGKAAISGTTTAT